MKHTLLLLGVIGVAHAEPEPTCVIEKPPVTKPSSAKPAPCHKTPARIAKAIRATIAKAYHPEQGGKPAVRFPCDGLGPKIFEIVVENGSGHGGSLGLWRAKRRSDGKFDVRGIQYRGSSRTHKATAVPHTQASGVVDLPELEKVRAAMTATVKEVLPPKKTGESFGTSGSFSSRDFHLVLRLVDDDGRVVEKRFTGYQTSSEQDRYLGLEIAHAALAPMWQLEPDPALAADDDDRAFFAASFTAAVSHFDEDFSWWVMERYVDLARFLGTPAVIGGLLTRLTLPAKADRSKIDARADALDALAKITGWDARKSTASPEAAAKAYLDTCK
jgi:hypothetical protein